MSEYDQPKGVEPRRPIRRAPQTTTIAPTPPNPPRASHGIGSNQSRCYCSCGGKLKHGQCVRGCTP